MTPRRPYKLAKRADLLPDPPFTPEGLRETIRDALGGKYAPPGDAEAVRLCGILNSWHAWFYEAQEQRKFNESVEQAEAALKTLQAVLPIIEKHHLKKAELGDPFATWQVRAAADLDAAVNKDPKRVIHRENLPDQARDWRWLAKVLPIDIKAAIQPTNPGYRGGCSKTGPLARVTASVIPSLTGERVGVVAVALQLGKAKQDIFSKAN